MPEHNYAILTSPVRSHFQLGRDIQQAVRRARQVLPEGTEVVGAIRADCLVLPDPMAGPYRVMVVVNAHQPDAPEPAPTANPSTEAPHGQ